MNELYPLSRCAIIISIDMNDMIFLLDDEAPSILNNTSPFLHLIQRGTV